MKQVYSIARVSAAYAVFGGVAFDCKQSLGENGITINPDEDYGERIKGADGSSLWCEYESSGGTIVMEFLPSSPAVPFFMALHATQRATGTTGLDSYVIVDRDMKTTHTASDVAIQSITGHTVKKAKGDMIVVTLNYGKLSSVGA
ncbi:phage protein [uncultured Parasutterella sp.]|uniref:phage protein n=1 Tax=uncultured Parasutterella sp. TaxID=1263098 RepID=UPI00272C59F8|nr:phage protein [uncultured Parasutterella sp.]